ncbi:hypothetical protein ABZ863_11125 [Saccharomonospora sp. NPDC046836]|uniref:hypothetical protein n=1 Tax=Saccharomonospora sp. NPDC046836 TaxID=3156921 RepID=UPI0033CE1023
MGFNQDRRELKHRCDGLIDLLPIPVPFEVTGFLQAFNRGRARPLELWRINPVDALPAGMYVPTAERDYVFVVRGTSAGHVRHHVFHEIGHIMLDHRCERLPGAARTAAFHAEEQEAEFFAYRLASRVRAEERRHWLRGPQRQLRSAFGPDRQLRMNHG